MIHYILTHLTNVLLSSYHNSVIKTSQIMRIKLLKIYCLLIQKWQLIRLNCQIHCKTCALAAILKQLKWLWFGKIGLHSPSFIVFAKVLRPMILCFKIQCPIIIRFLLSWDIKIFLRSSMSVMGVMSIYLFHWLVITCSNVMTLK